MHKNSPSIRLSVERPPIGRPDRLHGPDRLVSRTMLSDTKSLPCSLSLSSFVPAQSAKLGLVDKSGKVPAEITKLQLTLVPPVYTRLQTRESTLKVKDYDLV